MPSLEEAMRQSEDSIEQLDDGLITPVNDIFMINPETRVIEVPESERLFGVNFDKDVEKKYFKCPKIVGNNIDLSKHKIYVVYQKANENITTLMGEVGKYWCEDVRVDETGDYIEFSWLLSGNVLREQGFIAFKVVAVYIDTETEELKTRWNTVPSVGLVRYTLSDGEELTEQYADVITQLLQRMDAVEDIATPEAMQGYVEKYLGEHPVELDDTLTDSKKAAPANLVGQLKEDIGDVILKETSQNIFDEVWEVGGINSLGKDNNSQTSMKRTSFIDVDISNGLGIWRENSAPCLFQIFSYSENGTFLGSRRFFEAKDTNNFAFRDSSFAGFYVGTKKIRLVTDNLSIGKVQVQYSSTFTKYMQMGETENDGVNPSAVKNISLSAQTNDCGFITAFATDELNDRMFAMETRTGFKWRPFDCGKVVFMTDDTLSDIGVITSLLMNVYEFPMSYACITNTLENDVDVNDNGYKKVKDVLLASQSFGGEVFSHSINSDDWGANKATNGGYDGAIPVEESERRLRKSKETLRSYGIKCNGFISPRGSDLNGYAEQLAKYFRYAYYQGRDIPQICHFLRTNIKQMPFDNLKSLVDKCATDKSLLVLMCHTVVDTNGEGYGHYPNGFTLNNFKAVMDYLKWGNDTSKTTPRTDIEVTSLKAVYDSFASIAN